MNKERRKTLSAIADAVSAQREALQEVLDEEQEAFDALSEAQQEGERGEAMQAVIDSLTEAVDGLDNVAVALEELAGG